MCSTTTIVRLPLDSNTIFELHTDLIAVNTTVGIAFQVSSHLKIGKLVGHDCRGSCTPVDPPLLPLTQTSSRSDLTHTTTGRLPWIQSSRICRRMAYRSSLISLLHVINFSYLPSTSIDPRKSRPNPTAFCVRINTSLSFENGISNSAHFHLFSLPRYLTQSPRRLFRADRPGLICLSRFHCLYTLPVCSKVPRLHSVAYRSWDIQLFALGIFDRLCLPLVIYHTNAYIYAKVNTVSIDSPKKISSNISVEPSKPQT